MTIGETAGIKAIALFEAEIDFSDEELPLGLRDKVDAIQVLEAEIKSHVADPDCGGVTDFILRFWVRSMSVNQVRKPSLREMSPLYLKSLHDMGCGRSSLDLGGFP